jgi:hypothetical protein
MALRRIKGAVRRSANAPRCTAAMSRCDGLPRPSTPPSQSQGTGAAFRAAARSVANFYATKGCARVARDILAGSGPWATS